MLEALSVFGAFFLLGLVQSAPAITTGDSGEFAAAAATLSIAHAPGYPFYTLLARAFGVLCPLGSWAYRTNVLSSILTAGALALLVDALRRWGAGRTARVCAVAILGLAPQWREQSAVTEVFALLLFSASALLWIAAAADERLSEAGPAACLGLAFGLSLGNHQTVLLIAPSLLACGFGSLRRKPSAILWAAVGAACGFAIHAFIPVRARIFPPLDWDHAVTAAALRRLLTRQDYGTLSLTTEGRSMWSLSLMAEQAWRSLKGIGVQFGPIGAAVALIGAATWRRSSLRLPSSCAWCWVLVAGPVFFMIGRPPFDAQTSAALERFHLLPSIGVALFVAAGLDALRRVHPRIAAGMGVVALAALLPGAMAQNRRRDFLAYDFGRGMLRELPPRAVLAIDGGDDAFYSLAFLTFAQAQRPDVTLFDRGGVVFRSPYGSDFRDLPRDAKEARRRSVEIPLADKGSLWYSTLNANILPGFTLLPAGLLLRPVTRLDRFPEINAYAETMISPRSPDGDSRYRDRALSAFAAFSRAACAQARGRTADAASWMEAAVQIGGDALWVVPAVSYALGVSGYAASQKGDWLAAERAYRAQSRVDQSRPDPLTDLGVVLQKTGEKTQAEEAFRDALRRDPRSQRAWEALGALYWSQSKWAECVQAFESAAALPHGESAAAWAIRARQRIRP